MKKIFSEVKHWLRKIKKMSNSKVELDRVFHSGHDAITYLENDTQVVCLIEKDGEMIVRTELLHGYVSTENALGGGALCFDSKSYLGSMTCVLPPKQFDRRAYPMIVVGAKPWAKGDDTIGQWVIGAEGCSSISFVCSSYFNKIFQRVFLGDMSIQDAIAGKEPEIKGAVIHADE